MTCPNLVYCELDGQTGIRTHSSQFQPCTLPASSWFLSGTIVAYNKSSLKEICLCTRKYWLLNSFWKAASSQGQILLLENGQQERNQIQLLVDAHDWLVTFDSSQLHDIVRHSWVWNPSSRTLTFLLQLCLMCYWQSSWRIWIMQSEKRT